MNERERERERESERDRETDRETETERQTQIERIKTVIHRCKAKTKKNQKNLDIFFAFGYRIKDLSDQGYFSFLFVLYYSSTAR